MPAASLSAFFTVTTASYDLRGRMVSQTVWETVNDADSGAEIRKVVYTLGHDQIAQTTFTPAGPAEGTTPRSEFEP